MNEPHNELEKVEYLINCALYSTKSLKYCDLFGKK